MRERSLRSRSRSDRAPDRAALPSAWKCWPKWLSHRSAAVSSPIRFEQLRAYNWIALDDGFRTVRLEALPISGADRLVRVSARIRDGAGMPFVEAVVVLADAVRSPDAADLQSAPLTNPQAPIWPSDELYRTGMFHGPLFHSIEYLEAWDDTGLDALAGGYAARRLLSPG